MNKILKKGLFLEKIMKTVEIPPRGMGKIMENVGKTTIDFRPFCL